LPSRFDICIARLETGLRRSGLAGDRPLAGKDQPEAEPGAGTKVLPEKEDADRTTGVVHR
jgi:hypothetical protein